MKIRLHRLAAASFSLFLVAMLCPSASAQWKDSMSGVWNNPGSALTSTMIYNSMLLDAAKQPSPAKEGAAKSRQQPSSGRGQPIPTTFRPAGSSLMAQDLAAAFTKAKTERAQLADAFGQFLRVYEDDARNARQPHDVSRAAAFFVMTNYAIATSREPTETQFRGAQAKFHAGLSENPRFGALADRDRQKLYETLVIFGSLAVAGYNDAEGKKDLKGQQTYREFARQGIQTLLGVSVEKIHLTSTGFTIAD